MDAAVGAFLAELAGIFFNLKGVGDVCLLLHLASFSGFYGLFTGWIPELNIIDLGNIPSGVSGHLICTKNPQNTL